MRIVFMGTPDFAVPSLRRLLEDGHQVVAVYTQPDKPKGRGYQLTPPPVKELALEHDIPVYQPTKMRDGTVLTQLKELSPQLIVVVAYGRILPKAILELPPYGCVNLHASLLPKYRGAGPIQWSVIRGEKETGVTTMQMGEGLDTGDMLLKVATPIHPEETSGELHDRLCILGADLLSQTVVALEQGTVQPQKQEDTQATYAPMLDKKLGLMDFTKNAQELHNLIRGVSPWPTAYTYLGGKLLKIHKAKVREDLQGDCGTLLSQEDFVIGCGDFSLELLEVQLEGAKKMDAKHFLMGKSLTKGQHFGCGNA